MPNLTLAISAEIKQKMAMFPEINWSEVARQAILEKAKLMERMQRLLSKSKLTDEDAILLGRQVKHNAAKHHAKS